MQLITQQLHYRHANIARAIHNFKLLMEAFGDKDQQLADLIQSSNAVFATFAQENQNVQRTLQLLPGALSKTEQGLGKLATAFNVVGPTLHDLHPFAAAVAPAEEALRALVQDDHADLQERNPALRARNPADRSMRWSPA